MALITMRLMASRILPKGASAFSTSTAPKTQAYAAPTAGIGYQSKPTRKSSPLKGDAVPVYVAIGMIFLSSSLGLYTAMRELRHSPNVYVKKKRRETLPEVTEPEHVVQESDKFVKTSLFRKLGHVKGHAIPDVPPDHLIHEDSNLAALKVHVETLKDVGIDPNKPQ